MRAFTTFRIFRTGFWLKIAHIAGGAAQNGGEGRELRMKGRARAGINPLYIGGCLRTSTLYQRLAAGQQRDERRHLP
jgi:hypothetical protein